MTSSGRWLAGLLALAIGLALSYGSLAALSFRFGPDTPLEQRPILTALAVLAVSFAFYVSAILVGLKAAADRRMLVIVLAAGVVFRGISLYSWPILEIDIYRYLWDGAVTIHGVSPYRYSPGQVLAAAERTDLPEELGRLVRLSRASPAMGTILYRVHYAELPTIYPPVSQAAFAMVAAVTPERAGVFTRIVAMKIALVLFDLAAFVVLVWLLQATGKHAAWSVAYGWCPLVIKEFANTGHLDSLAVFLTVLALYLLYRSTSGISGGGVRQTEPCQRNRPPSGDCGSDRRRTFVLGTRRVLDDGDRDAAASLGKSRTPWGRAVASAILLALAIGAKIYPVVLVPVFAAVWAKSFRWKGALALGLLCSIAALVVLSPMLPRQAFRTPGQPTVSAPADTEPGGKFPDAEGASVSLPQNPAAGLMAFVQHWEMNDWLFMLVFENLKPTAERLPEQTAWFAVVPDVCRRWMCDLLSRCFGVDAGRSPFLSARLITGLAFVVIVAGLLWRQCQRAEPSGWLRVAFLTLAWFWLLSPTQNPWYWTWALPLVMFARSRAWLAVSGLAMLYYLRFWFACHWPHEPVLGWRYSGAAFFDFVVPWVEYGPWFLWLAWDTVRQRS